MPHVTPMASLSPVALDSSAHRSATPPRTIGLDVGDRYTHRHELDATGMTFGTGRFATTPAALERELARAPMGGSSSRAARIRRG